MPQHRGFTLIELLVVVGLVAALSVVVALVLNPAELLRQARDSSRMSDVTTIKKAISIYQSDIANASLGVASTTYTSLVDTTATSSAGTDCGGFGFGSGFRCAASSSVQLTNGSGWVPINLNQIASRSPISSWPIDPTNTSSTGLYYLYTFSGSSFKVATKLESNKYTANMATDGGTSATLFETGTNMQLAIAAVGPAPQPVSWTAVVGANAVGGTLTKTAAGAWGNSGAVSSQTLASGNGYVEFTANATNDRMVGLSNGSVGQNYPEIDFALYAAGGGILNVYENGVSRGSFGTYTAGTVFRVDLTGGVVRYYRNGVLFYTSLVAPTYPLLVDTSLYSNGTDVTNAVVYGF